MNKPRHKLDPWIEEHIKEFRESERSKGMKSDIDVNDELAKRRGFENYNEFMKYYSHNKGKCLTYDKNMNCSLWLGIHIAERILPEIYENVEMMPLCNTGFDAICSKDYKIDVKSSCILSNRSYNYYNFSIKKNIIADYFIMFGFDNRENLNLLIIWLIKGTEIIKGRKLNEIKELKIANSDIGINKYKKYELSNELLSKAKDVCKKLKDEINIKSL